MSKISATPENPLFLHLDTDGCVWSIRAGFQSCRTNLQAEDFINQSGLTGPVRILGSPGNAGLIQLLSAISVERADIRVQLGTPRMAFRRMPVDQLLESVSQLPPQAASLGGWRPLQPGDGIVYRLAQLRGSQQLETIAELARTHPIWPWASFIPSLTATRLGEWLAVTLDPRWYINPDKPDSDAALFAYLGLLPDVMESMLHGTQNERCARCHAVYRCWMPGTIEEWRQLQYNAPRNFLGRIFGGMLRSGDRYRAATRTSQVCVQFLKGLWLNSSGTAQSDPLFVPETFFKLEVERDAYRDFVQSRADSC